jgi:membrane protein required for colicin V production
MSILDIVLIGLFILAGFSGYRKGLVGQAAGLIGLILGIWGAIHFSDFTANFLSTKLSITTQYLPMIAFAVTFTVLLVGVHFVGVIAEKIMDLAFLGLANSLLGVVFGVLKTALILSVILLLLGKISHKVKIIPDNFGEKSLLYKPIERLAPTIFPYLNFDEIKCKVEETFTTKKTENNQKD